MPRLTARNGAPRALPTSHPRDVYKDDPSVFRMLVIAGIWLVMLGCALTAWAGALGALS